MGKINITAILSAVIAGLVLLVTYNQFNIDPNNPKELTVWKYTSRDLTSGFPRGELADQDLLIQINGEELVEFHVIVEILQNSGRIPITPTDYYENLTVSVGKDWKMQLITSELAGPSNSSFVWTRISENTFEATPKLINPGDAFIVSAYVSPADPSNISNDAPELTWDGRIENLSRIKVEEGLIQGFSSAYFVTLSIEQTALVITIALAFTVLYSYLFFKLGLFPSDSNTAIGRRNRVVFISTCLIIGFCGAEASATLLTTTPNNIMLMMNLPIAVFNFALITWLIYRQVCGKNW